MSDSRHSYDEYMYIKYDVVCLRNRNNCTLVPQQHCTAPDGGRFAFGMMYIGRCCPTHVAWLLSLAGATAASVSAGFLNRVARFRDTALPLFLPWSDLPMAAPRDAVAPATRGVVADVTTGAAVRAESCFPLAAPVWSASGSATAALLPSPTTSNSARFASCASA